MGTTPFAITTMNLLDGKTRDNGTPDVVFLAHTVEKGTYLHYQPNVPDIWFVMGKK